MVFTSPKCAAMLLFLLSQSTAFLTPSRPLNFQVQTLIRYASPDNDIPIRVAMLEANECQTQASLARMETLLEKLDTKMDSKFDKLETKMDSKFDKLDTKIDANYKELITKFWFQGAILAVILVLNGMEKIPTLVGMLGK